MFAKHPEAKKGNRNVLYNQSQCSQDIKTKAIVFYKRDFNFYKKNILKKKKASYKGTVLFIR